MPLLQKPLRLARRATAAVIWAGLPRSTQGCPKSGGCARSRSARSTRGSIFRSVCSRITSANCPPIHAVTAPQTHCSISHSQKRGVKKGISPIIDAPRWNGSVAGMPRTARVAPGGYVFHVLNRGNERRSIFESEGDYLAFLRVLSETLERIPVRILAWCLMPNHWHLLLWPKQDGELGHFMQRLTTTHVRRWRLYRQSVGHGHLYQGTYKSFPVEADDHFYTVCRYVERNALRAKLVKRAEAWPWSSLGVKHSAAAANESPAAVGVASRPSARLGVAGQ